MRRPSGEYATLLTSTVMAAEAGELGTAQGQLGRAEGTEPENAGRTPLLRRAPGFEQRGQPLGRGRDQGGPSAGQPPDGGS